MLRDIFDLVDQNELSDPLNLLQRYWLEKKSKNLQVPARRHTIFYPCCLEPYPDITFTIVIRRKTLFFTGKKSLKELYYNTRILRFPTLY